MFLLMGPITNILLLYVLAAVLPAIFLMLYVYNQSRMHRQPTSLLVRLVWDGVKPAEQFIIGQFTKLSCLSGIPDCRCRRRRNKVLLHAQRHLAQSLL